MVSNTSYGHLKMQKGYDFSMSETSFLKVVQTCISNLTETFLLTPYLFYTESDLHCYFYKLLSRQLEDSGFRFCQTQDNKLSSLLHKEYPTKKRYRQKLEDPTGRRGHFDICIWNPDKVSERVFRNKSSEDIDKTQQTYFAFEFLLPEGTEKSNLKHALTHTKWDMLKLSENEVKYGYILVFARDWNFREEFLRAVKEMNMPSNIALIFVENSDGEKFIERLGRK